MVVIGLAFGEISSRDDHYNDDVINEKSLNGTENETSEFLVVEGISNPWTPRGLAL